MKVRTYTHDDDPRTEGRDEGGAFFMKEVPQLSHKLQLRMVRCAGCRNDFYNGRANATANHCWSLDKDKNFPRTGRPRCYHH